MNTDKLKGQVVHLEEDFGISLQFTNGLAMAHCEVNKMSHSIIKRVSQRIDILQREHRRDGYGVSEVDDHKHARFLKLIGFEKLKNKWVLDEHGDDKIITIWIRQYDINR